jgi:cobalt-zinc-cadmium efflux system outer membrane protein
MVGLPSRAASAYLLVIVATSMLANAEEGIPPPGLTLTQAIERTLAANPALRGFSFRLDAGQAQIDQARQRPATEVSLEVENVLGGGELSDFDAAETTLALSKVVEFGDKRAGRTAVAEASRDVLVSEREIARLDTLAEVARRFIHVVAIQEKQKLATEATTIAQRTVVEVERRVRAARSPEADLFRARAALANAELDEREAARQLRVSRRRLSALWNSAKDDFGPLEANLYALAEPEDFDRLAERLDASADLLRFASETRLREAAVRLARSQRRPDVVFSGGIRRLEAIEEQAFVLGVTVPFGLSSRAAPRVAEAVALRELNGVERETALIRVRTELFDLHLGLQQAVAEVNSLRANVLPAVAGALSQSEYAYERGRYSYLELADAQKAKREAQQRLLDAAERGRLLWVEIERLTGEPLEERR